MWLALGAALALIGAAGVAGAAQIGWTKIDRAIESSHSLPNDHTEEITVEAPPGASKLRVVFSRIRMESGYDFISIRDASGFEVERITGDHDAYVSLPVSGSIARVVAVTDGSIKSWGFQIAGFEYRGCAIDPVPDPRLTTATSCEHVRREIERAAVEEIRARFGGGGFVGPLLRAAGELARPLFSLTNVRTEGIDEGDVAKTDGRYIYSLAGRQLRMFTTATGEQALLRYAVDIEGAPRDLLLHGDRVIVLSGVPEAGLGDVDDGFDVARSFAPWWWTPDASTKVTILDLTSGAPVIADEVMIPGHYVTSRLVDGTLRLTVRRSIEWPEIQWYPEDVPWGTHEYEQRLDELEQAAIAAVTGRALAEWLPSSAPLDCEAFALGALANARVVTSVVRLDVGAGADDTRRPIADVSLLAQSELVYQTEQSLYLAGQVVDRCIGDPYAEQHSYIHALRLSTAAGTTYVASGLVRGTMIDEFALDEAGEYLRVATTEVSWRTPDPGAAVDNRVRVLGVAGDRLVEVGVTEALAPGEGMRSVRFVGDRAYVVTFRMIDPIFAIDLSEPTAPRVLGELTLPGFSTYLHPVSEDRVFGLGHELDETGVERLGVALTLYDVSGAAPVALDRLVIGTGSGFTIALEEHRAFTFYRPAEDAPPVLAIPFTDWEYDAAADLWRPRSELVVVEIGDDALHELGRVDVSGLMNGDHELGWWSRPMVQRGLFVDDLVYAVTDHGIRAGRITDPTERVVEVRAAPKTVLPDGVLRLEVTEAVWPDAVIADVNPLGTLVAIEVAADMTVDKVSVSYDIEHTAPGDLLVTLFRLGHARILRAWQDSPEPRVAETVHPDLRGVPARGTWYLWVVDTVPLDAGHVRSVRLELKGPVPRM